MNGRRETGVMFMLPMVLAIKEDRKSQTRRVMNPQPVRVDGGVPYCDPPKRLRGAAGSMVQRPPYGHAGDLIYVKETWQHSNHPYGPYQPGCDVFYRADYVNDALGIDGEKSGGQIKRTWRSSMLMPKACARLWLEITSVRVERLNDISEADATAEGVYSIQCGDLGQEVPYYRSLYEPRDLYRMLWERIHGSFSWGGNPYVWVYNFRKVKHAADRPAKR